MSSNVKAALIGLVAIALAIAALIFFIRDRNSSSAINAHLRTTANHLTPHLERPGGHWAAAGSFREKYRQFAAREQMVIKRLQRSLPQRQFLQIQLIPQHGTAPGLLLASRAGTRVLVNPIDLLLTQTSRQPRYISIQQSGALYQAFVQPLKLPQALRRQHVAALLEVIQG